MKPTPRPPPPANAARAIGHGSALPHAPPRAAMRNLGRFQPPPPPSVKSAARVPVRTVPATKTGTRSPSVHVSITDIDPDDSEVSVSVSLRTAQTKRRPFPLLGTGRYGRLARIILTGLAVTLVVSVVSILVLMYGINDRHGGTSMQTHHSEDDELGTRHSLAHSQPTIIDRLTNHDRSPSVRSDEVVRVKSPVKPPKRPAPSTTRTSANALDWDVRSTAAGDDNGSNQPPPAPPSVDSLLLPPFESLTPPPITENLTLYTIFSPHYLHIPSIVPIQSWTLLFSNSTKHILVYAPDDPTCHYLTVTCRLPVTCRAHPVCFDDRNKKRRKKVNKGLLVWEHDIDSKREAKLICVLKDIDRKQSTPLVAHVDNNVVLTQDFTQSVQRVVDHRLSDRGNVSGPLTADGVKALRKKPFLVIGRTWAVNDSDSDNLLSIDIANTSDRQTLYHALSKLRARSLHEHLAYESRYSRQSDRDFFHRHNTFAIHWFVYLRNSLPMYAMTKSTYMSDVDHLDPYVSDDSEEARATHGWESFVVWAATSKGKQPMISIDVSQSSHCMAIHRHQHHHGNESVPPSLAVIPPNTNDTEAARLTANITNYVPNNPFATPLSPASATLRMTGNCYKSVGSCQLVDVKHSNEQELLLLIESRLSASKELILLIANYEYLLLAYNLLCQLQSHQLDNYIIVAEDRLSFFALKARSLPVVLVEFARHRKRTSFTGTESLWLFDETLYHRARLLSLAHAVLNASVLVLHLDLFLLESPSLTIFSQNQYQCDFFTSVNHTIYPSGGVFYYPQTPLARVLVRQLVECEEENVAFARIYGGNRFVFSDDKDASCLYQLITRLVTRENFRSCELDGHSFTNEVQVYRDNQPMRSNQWPILVHVDGQKTVNDKVFVMQQWRQWYYDADRDARYAAEQTELPLLNEKQFFDWQRRQLSVSLPSITCRAPHSVADPMAPATGDRSAATSIDVRIVVNYDDYRSLNHTLASLAFPAVSQHTNLRVRLIIDVTSHSVKGDSVSTEGQSQLIALLESSLPSSLSLHSDAIEIRAIDQLAEIDFQYFDSFESQSSMVLFVTAGQTFAPLFWSLVSALLHHYPINCDRHLVSLSFSHQSTIIGETPSDRYGTRLTESILAKDFSDRDWVVYRSQISSVTASLFYRHSLAHFQEWYRNVSASRDRVYACIPTLLTNIDLMHHSDSVSVDHWLHRYLFEHGHYVMKFFCKREVKIDQEFSRVIPRVVALNPVRIDPQSLHSELLPLTQSMLDALRWPPINELPLYDFHFAHVYSSMETFSKRSLLFAPYNPGDRTLGTMADDPQAQSIIEKQLALEAGEEDADDDDEDESAVEVVDVQGKAGVSADNTTLPIKVRAKRLINDTELLDRLSFIRLLLHGEQRLHPQPVANNQSMIYAGSMQDRCFVQGAVNDVRVDSEDEEMRIKPYIPPHNHPAYHGLQALHWSIIDRQHPLLTAQPPSSPASKPSLLIYQPRIVDATGTIQSVAFDRSLRGLYFAFLLSLCLDRMLLIDLPSMKPLYENPYRNVSWFLDDYSPPLLTGLNRVTFNQSHANMLRTGNVQLKLKQYHIVYYSELISLDRPLMGNKYYRWLSVALFDSHSRSDRLSALMQYLLSTPTPALHSQAMALVQRYHLHRHQEQRVIGVRLDMRDESEWPSLLAPFPSIPRNYFDCINSLLKTFGSHPNNTIIFFSSNRPSRATFDAFKARYQHYGRVLTYTDTMTKLRAHLVQTLRLSGGDKALLPAEALIGYLIGELPVVITSDTTFGIFQTARTGLERPGWKHSMANSSHSPAGTVIDHRWLYGSRGSYVFSNEEKGGQGAEYCGPLHRRDRPKRFDVIF